MNPSFSSTLPAVPVLPAAPAGHRSDRTWSELVVLLGLGGDAAVACSVMSLTLWGWRNVPGVAGAGAPAPGPLWVTDAVAVAVALLALLVSFEENGVYRRDVLLNVRQVFARVVRASLFWLLLCAGLALFCRAGTLVPPELLATAGGATILGLLGWRWGFHHALKASHVSARLRQRVVLLGWTADATRLASQVWKYDSDPYEIVGYVALREPSPDDPSFLEATVPYLGNHEELAHILAAERADVALLADLHTEARTTQSLVALCERELVHFKIIPSYFPILVSGLHVEMVSGTPLLGVDRLPLHRTGNVLLKRAFDIVGSLVGLALFAPIIAYFAARVYLESPGAVFYRQRRLGRAGRCFEMIKIRSMRLDAEKSGKVGWTVKDDPRRLRVGAFMRKWNVDELPQFWNVLKGEMSLVGPRPERPELIADFKHTISHYNARHFIKPGLTGWAQINGLRGDTDLSERIRCDLYYAEHWSLWLDVKIMFLTFFKRQGAC